MYEIWADDICIYSDVSPLETVQVIDPVLNLSDSAAGSLTFTIPPNNVGYDKIKRVTSRIRVKREGTEIWEGRVLTEDEDFWKKRKFVCEGELAYLNDTLQPQSQFQGTIIGFLTQLINEHNKHVTTNDMKFYLGEVTVTDPNDYILRYTNYETTLECINKKLVENLGGHLRIRKVNGKRYLDYLADYPVTSEQEIRFGYNLLDFTKNWDLSELATVIIPLGKSLEESKIESLTEYLTVEKATKGDGSIYVKSDAAVSNFGWICKTVHWDDVEDVNNLYKKAVEYLENFQFDSMTLTVSAVDLHYLTGTDVTLNLLDKVLCISTPHNLNKYFPITAISLNLADPSKTTYTMGTKEVKSLTASTNSLSSTITDKIEEIRFPLLEEARNNATEIIKAATSGYVSMSLNNGHPYELLIMDKESKEKATKAWIWNSGGFGYISCTDNKCRKAGYETNKVTISRVFVKDSKDPSGYSIDSRLQMLSAMTMDGAIVADRITSGSMVADRIKGGSLVIGGTNLATKDGSIVIKDAKNTTLITLDKNGMTLSGGQTISWTNVSNKPTILTKSDVTTITQNTVSTYTFYGNSYFSTDKKSWFAPDGYDGKTFNINGTYPFYIDTTGRAYATRLFSGTVAVDKNFTGIINNAFIGHNPRQKSDYGLYNENTVFKVNMQDLFDWCFAVCAVIDATHGYELENPVKPIDLSNILK